MKDYLQTYSQTLIRYSYSISDQIKLTIGHLDKEPQLFHYTVLRKLLNSLVAIGLGLDKVMEYRPCLDSLCVTARMSLSDIITWEYIRHISKSDSEFTNNIYRLYFDHISKLRTSIKRNYPLVLRSTPEKINEWSSKLDSLDKFYDSNGNPKYSNLDFSIYKAIRYIFQNKKYEQGIYSFLSYAFIYYDQYSKYEHFGEASFNLSSVSLHDKWFHDAICEFCVAIIPIPEYALRIFEEFKKTDDIIIDKNIFSTDLNMLRKLAMNCPTHNSW